MSDILSADKISFSKILALLFVVLPVTSNPCFAKTEGWYMRQNSQIYGMVSTVVSSEGIRLEMKDIKITLSKPGWKVTFWNEKTNFIFDETIEDFKRRTPVKADPTVYDSKVIPGKPAIEIFAGVKAKHYQWVKVRKDGTAKPSVVYDFACSQEMGLPKEVGDVASLCCYIPIGYGLPLRVSGGQNRGMLLNTTFLKKGPVDLSIYKPPKNIKFKRVRSEMEVLLKEKGTADDADVSDLFKAIPGK
ncbi:MAG: hypothetical protein IAF58_23335 [Leptolyngbya sp.]|nr:hypothetical protein [Candidatus Melainabacteria bacterium]